MDYTIVDREIGIEFIKKLESNSLTVNDFKLIKEDPNIKEIFETVQNPRLRQQFIKKYQVNIHTNNYSSSLNSRGLDFIRLVNNIDIVNAIGDASIDNLVREREELRNKGNRKKRKGKKKTKNKKQSRSL